MGPARRVKPDEESLLPPPTTIEEFWMRMSARIDSVTIREDDGDQWLRDFIQYLRQTYANYRKID
jgi:hypothetical protein